MSNSRVSVSTYPVVNQVNDERWVPPLPDAQKPTDPNTPHCAGCGGYHGSVNAERLCMRAALAAARDRLRTLDLIEGSIRAIKELPSSEGGSVQVPEIRSELLAATVRDLETALGLRGAP